VFRERCFTAGLAASTGMTRYLKTLVGNIPGVTFRLIGVRQQGDQYVAMVGGGDQYQVAYAIWQSNFYTPGLAGAEISVANISNTNPVTITTQYNHNLVTGDVETIMGTVRTYLLNGLPMPITVTGPKTFTMPIDATMWGTYLSGGVVYPNPINMFVSIMDEPDSYVIPFVNPPQETVNIILVWRTNSLNYVNPDSIAQAAVQPIVDYVNSLPVGTTPLNLNVMTQVFLEAIADIIPGELMIDIEWTISINGIGVYPSVGQTIFGDPNSFFWTQNGNVVIVEGT